MSDKMKESDIQVWVQGELKRAFGKSIYIFKVPQSQYISRKGIPDLIACIEGYFLAIEVKTLTGTLTELQKFEISKIVSARGMSVVVYGKDEIRMAKLIKELRVVIDSD